MMKRQVTVALVLVLALVAVGEAPAGAASYVQACDGASEAQGAFPDAGFAADCLKMYGVSLGKDDGTFGEADALLRSQVSSLLARLIALAGATLSQRHSFVDVTPDTVPNAQVRDEIELLAGSGVIEGFPDGTFGPTLNLTVAQGATLVVRTLEFIDAQRPEAYDVRDQGTTGANYDYAIQIGVLDPNAPDVHGNPYPTNPGETTARGLLADMLATGIQGLVDRGVVGNRSTVATFGDGQYEVNTQIPAVTYRTTQTSGGCYWERESGFGGTLDEIIANDFTTAGPEIVTIDPSDAGFKSDGCIQWSSKMNALKSASSPIPEGMWLVGSEVGAGTYHASAQPGTSCYWARLSGFSGELDDIIANGISSSPQVVTVSASDRGFASHGCTDWAQ
jgi:hypothetical protein